MATLTVADVTVAGVQETLTAAAGGGDVFANQEGRTYLRVNNGGGAPITVTINSVTPCDQGSDHDGGSAVTNGTSKVFGPFSPRRFNDTNGNVSVTYTGVTSVTVGAFRLPNPIG